MPRKRKSLLELPANAKADIKTLSGILDKYAGEAEEVIKGAFTWGKKHKVLLAFVAGLVILWRYWLAEPQNNSAEY